MRAPTAFGTPFAKEFTDRPLEKPMSVNEPKLPPPDPEPEPERPHQPGPDTDEPSPDVIEPGFDPLPA